MSRVDKYSLYSALTFFSVPALAADASSSGGAMIPHMDVATFASQLFWLAICFCLLYFIVSRVALPQVQGILARRQDTIQGNLEKAAKLRDEAEDIQIAYDKALRQADNHAQDFLNNSLEDMAEKNALKLNDAMDKISDKIQKAEAKIANQRDKAIKEATKIADGVADDLTKKVLKIQQIDSKKTKKKSA